MSNSADDRDPHTPFDARLDAAMANASIADDASAQNDATQDATAHGNAAPQATPASAFTQSGATAQARTVAQERWDAFRRDKLMPVLRRERQLSHAMQLALAAVGGALLVVVTSTVIGVALPHPDQPTVANNQHPLVTVEDLTAKALKEKGVDGVQSSDANSVDAEGNASTTPDISTTNEEESNAVDTDAADVVTDSENTSQEANGGDSGAPGTLAALSSDPKRERKRPIQLSTSILKEC